MEIITVSPTPPGWLPVEGGIWARDVGHRRVSSEEEGGGEGDASRRQRAPKTASQPAEPGRGPGQLLPHPALTGTSPADTLILDLGLL